MKAEDFEPRATPEGTWQWEWNGGLPPVVNCMVPTMVFMHLGTIQRGSRVVSYPTREAAMDALRAAIQAAETSAAGLN